MKFILQLFFLGAVAAESGTWPKYVPTRISFEDLANGGGDDSDGVFWKTLREVGLLSITDIPEFKKESMLNDLEDCLHHQSVGAPEFVFDTTHKDQHQRQRRTLATRTLAGTPDDILVATSKRIGDGDKLCGDLRASSRAFRSAVQTVSEAIATRFGAANSRARTNDAIHHKIPIQNLINEGEHLEHFHSYYSEEKESHAGATTPSTTIDWHTDQGMMLLFTPGQHKDGTTTDGFYIQLGDGSTVEVAFDSRIDDLVIMLGDGVRQYVNDPLSSSTGLRAVPHAVSLPPNSAPRLWYGRMVLPPPEAIHPSGDRSFADLRTAMIRGDKHALALGCAEASETARELMEDMHDHGGEDEALECDEDVSMLCWMRCMNYSDFDVGIDSCAAKSESHSLLCANDGGELWEKGVHSDEYYVRCLAAEEVVEGSGGSMGMDHDHSGMDHDMEDHSSSSAPLAPAFGTAFGLVLASLAL